MPLYIVRNSITDLETEAYVCPVGLDHFRDGGVEGVLRKAGGPKYKRANEKIWLDEPGQVKVTWGYDLPCRYVYHVSTNPYAGGGRRDIYYLGSAYSRVLKAAARRGITSIAFPLLGTGRCGYPASDAFEVAIHIINAFLQRSDMDVYLAIHNKKTFNAYNPLIQAVETYLADNHIPDTRPAVWASHPQEDILLDLLEDPTILPASQKQQQLQQSSLEKTLFIETLPSMEPGLDSIQEYISHPKETFQEMLLRLIDERDITDVECYKRANISRKHFSKIRSNRDYQPARKTVIAFALALRLTLDQTRALLETCGYSLSRSNSFDLIIQYFLEHSNYDLFAINEVLLYFDQPLL